MNQLLENTYLAYNQFMEGELNQYDLMSLVEEGIISGEVLESMLEEGFLSSVVLGHHLNNATPADSYKTNSLLQHSNKTPIVKHIADINHTQNYLKNSNKKLFDIMNPKITDNDRKEHKKELENSFKTLGKLHDRIGRDKSDEVNDEIESKYGSKYGKDNLFNQTKYILKNKKSIDELNKPLNRMRYNSYLNNIRSGVKDMKGLLAKKYLEKKNEEIEDKKERLADFYNEGPRPEKTYKGHNVRSGVINVDPQKFITKKLYNDDKKSNNDTNYEKEQHPTYKSTALTKYMSKKYKNPEDRTKDFVKSQFSNSKYDNEEEAISNMHHHINKELKKSVIRGNGVDNRLYKEFTKSTNEYNTVVSHAKHLDELSKDKNMPKDAREELTKLQGKINEHLSKVREKHMKNIKKYADHLNGDNIKHTYNI